MQALYEKDVLERQAAGVAEKEKEIEMLRVKLAEMEEYKQKYENSSNEEQMYTNALEELQADLLALDKYNKELEEKLRNCQLGGEIKPAQRRMSSLSNRSIITPSNETVDRNELIATKQALEYLRYKQFIEKVRESESKLALTLYNPKVIDENAAQQLKKKYRDAVSAVMRELTLPSLTVVDLSNKLVSPEKQLLEIVSSLEKQRRQLEKINHSLNPSSLKKSSYTNPNLMK